MVSMHDAAAVVTCYMLLHVTCNSSCSYMYLIHVHVYHERNKFWNDCGNLGKGILVPFDSWPFLTLWETSNTYWNSFTLSINNFVFLFKFTSNRLNQERAITSSNNIYQKATLKDNKFDTIWSVNIYSLLKFTILMLNYQEQRFPTCAVLLCFEHNTCMYILISNTTLKKNKYIVWN